MRVLIAHPRLDEIAIIGPGPEPRDVPGEHVMRHLATHQPFGHHQTDPRRLAEAGDDAATGEIAAQFGHRTKHHVGIGRPDHRAVDHPLDPGLGHGGHPVDGAHHVVLDPVEIVGKEIMREIERRAVLGPEPHVALIGPDQQALALLSQVIFAVPVRDRWQAPVHPGDRGNGLGHEILVLGRLQGQLDAGQPRHLARPQPGGVDHPRRADLALRCLDDPCAVRLGPRGRHRRETMDLCAPLPRPDGIGIGHTRRIDIAAIGLEHDGPDAVEIDQRVQPLGLVPRNLVEIHPVKPGLGGLKAQLMRAVLGLRKVQAAGLKHAAALPRLGLQIVVKRHRVMLQTADVGAVMQPVGVGRRMPGRSARQLVALQQHHVAPAKLCQMIQDRAPDHAAADHDRLCMGFHRAALVFLPGSSLACAPATRLPVADMICRCDTILPMFLPAPNTPKSVRGSALHLERTTRGAAAPRLHRPSFEYFWQDEARDQSPRSSGSVGPRPERCASRAGSR